MPSTHQRLERAAGRLSTAAVARIESSAPWYPTLPANERSWVGVLAQTGIAAFIKWHADQDAQLNVYESVFGAAPRELTRSISLPQTLELVRAVVAEVEEQVPEIAVPGDETRLREAVLTYSREIAFGVAEVYAHAAEERGQWDARLEALVVDAVLRARADEDLGSRAAALGWDTVQHVAVVAGAAPRDSAAAVEELRRHADNLGLDVLTGVHERRLVAVVGGLAAGIEQVTPLARHWAPGPVVVGPRVPHLFAAGRSARAALSGLAAAPGWTQAPRPCPASDLLPERALAGERRARRQLIQRVARGLERESVAHTVATYLETAGLEASARRLFVHPNTVRYRLARYADESGYDLTDTRDAFAVRIGLALGRLPEQVFDDRFV